MNFKVNALNACVEISRSLYAIKWLELNRKCANFQSFSTTKQKSLFHCLQNDFFLHAKGDYRQILQVLNCLILWVSDNEAPHFWRPLNGAISTVDNK